MELVNEEYALLLDWKDCSSPIYNDKRKTWEGEIRNKGVVPS